MKRSEAISRIKEEIGSIIYLYNSGELDIDTDAEVLLNFFEYDLGMQYAWEFENEDVVETVAQDSVWIPDET